MKKLLLLTTVAMLAAVPASASRDGRAGRNCSRHYLRHQCLRWCSQLDLRDLPPSYLWHQ